MESDEPWFLSGVLFLPAPGPVPARLGSPGGSRPYKEPRIGAESPPLRRVMDGAGKGKGNAEGEVGAVRAGEGGTGGGSGGNRGPGNLGA